MQVWPAFSWCSVSCIQLLTEISVDVGLNSEHMDGMATCGGFLLCVIDEPALMTAKHSGDMSGGKDDVEIGVVVCNAFLQAYRCVLDLLLFIMYNVGCEPINWRDSLRLVS